MLPAHEHVRRVFLLRAAVLRGPWRPLEPVGSRRRRHDPGVLTRPTHDRIETYCLFRVRGDRERVEAGLAREAQRRGSLRRLDVRTHLPRILELRRGTAQSTSHVSPATIYGRRADALRSSDHDVSGRRAPRHAARSSRAVVPRFHVPGARDVHATCTLQVHHHPCARTAGRALSRGSIEGYTVGPGGSSASLRAVVRGPDRRGAHTRFGSPSHAGVVRRRLGRKRWLHGRCRGCRRRRRVRKDFGPLGFARSSRPCREAHHNRENRPSRRQRGDDRTHSRNGVRS